MATKSTLTIGFHQHRRTLAEPWMHWAFLTLSIFLANAVVGSELYSQDLPNQGVSQPPGISPIVLEPVSPIAEVETRQPPSQTQRDPIQAEELPLGNLAPQPDQQLRLQVLLRAARNAVALRDFTGAIKHFEELFHEFPSFTEAKSEFIGVLVQTNEFQKAEGHLGNWIAKQPNELSFQLLYTEVLIQQGKHSLAENWLRKIVDNAQADPKAIVNFARVLTWQGKLAEANHVYQSRLSHFDLFPVELQLHIANLQLALNRPEEATSLFNRLLEVNPTDPVVLAGLVLGHVRLGNESMAYQYLERLAPDSAFTANQRLDLGDTLFRESFYRPALFLFQSASSLAPADLSIQTRIVRTHLRLFDMSAAKATLDSIASHSSEREVRLVTASYCTAIGEHAMSYAIYRSLMNQHPKDAEVIKGMGVLWHAIGDFPAAEAKFRQGIEVAPRDAEMKQLLGESLVMQLRAAEARAVLETPTDSPQVTAQPAIFANGRSADTNRTAPAIADLLFRAGDYAAAEQVCQMALAGWSMNSVALNSGALGVADPSRPLHSALSLQPSIDLRITLGFAQLKLGRNSEALDTFLQTRSMPSGNTAKLRYGIYCCLMNMERGSDAESILVEELKAFAPLTFDRVTIAKLAMSDCDWQLAARLLEQGLKFDRGNVYLTVLLGEALAMGDRCIGGCNDRKLFTGALTASPRNTRAQLGLARSHARTSEFETSVGFYHTIQRAFPQHQLARIECARATYAWRGVDDANCVYGAAVAQSRPNDFLPDTNNPNADLRMLQSEYEYADHRRQTIEHERSGKYFKDWQPLTSLYHYQALRDLDPTNQECLFDLAQIYTGLNRSRDAIQHYDELLILDSCHTEAKQAKRRLQLELNPQVRNSFDFEYRAGRQGLTDITTSRLESVAIKPLRDQDEFLMAGYAHRFLRPLQGTDADGNVGILGFQAKPIDYLNVFAIAELEQYDSGFRTRVPFRSGVRWRSPNDVQFGLTGFLENVPANGEAIRQDIHRGGIELTMATFLTWRWELESLYRYASYVDRNSTHEAMILSDYLLVPGRHQLRTKWDWTLITFDEQTQFAPNPSNLFGTIHPYFSPSGFSYVSGGLEYRTWLSPHNFRGANEHWYSVYGGGRIDSDSVGYGLVQAGWHRDYRGLISAQINTSAIFSKVYTSVGVGGFITFRLP